MKVLVAPPLPSKSMISDFEVSDVEEEMEEEERMVKQEKRLRRK